MQRQFQLFFLLLLRLSSFRSGMWETRGFIEITKQVKHLSSFASISIPISCRLLLLTFSFLFFAGKKAILSQIMGKYFLKKIQANCNESRNRFSLKITFEKNESFANPQPTFYEALDNSHRKENFYDENIIILIAGEVKFVNVFVIFRVWRRRGTPLNRKVSWIHTDYAVIFLIINICPKGYISTNL